MELGELLLKLPSYKMIRIINLNHKSLKFRMLMLTQSICFSLPKFHLHDLVGLATS